MMKQTKIKDTARRKRDNYFEVAHVIGVGDG